MGIHARLLRLLDILRESICRHRYNRNPPGIGPVKTADRPCTVLTVHNRHLDIHEDSVITLLTGLFKYLYCLPAIAG